MSNINRMSAGAVDVLADLDELIARDEERQDYCSETGPNDAMRRVVVMKGIRAVVAELIEAIERDAADRAIASGLGVSEWRSFIPPNTAAALSRVGGA